MNKIFTRFALVLAVVLGFAGSQNLYATHITGSDISFRCLGGNNYQVLVAVYRDCSGASMPSSIPINVSRGCASDTNLTATLDPLSSNVEVSQLCPNVVSTCNGGSLPGVQLYTYVANININPGCGLFTFSYGDCCRNTSTNLVDPSAPSLSFYVEATLNTSGVVCNNAPIFTSLPVPYFCVNQPVNYSHGALDLDGDSLVYQLVDPLEGAGIPLSYYAGYSAASPLPTASGFNFDASSGQMSFTPTTQGVYVVDVLVSEYRNGVLIGTTMRDIQIIVINCSNASPVVQNSLYNSNVTGGVINDYNSVGVCPGSTLSFTVGARDPDGQTVTVTSNLGASIPTATLTTVNVGVDSVRTTFTWTPSALDTGFRYFTLQFEDNACPITGLQLFTYDITIFEGTEAGPNRFYCPSGGPLEVKVNGGTHFSWNTTVGMVSATPDSNIVYLAPPATTTYIIQSDLQGGCKDKDTITVFNVPSITTGITANYDTICLNQTANLTVTAGPANQGPFTYLWSNVSDGVLNPTQQSTNVKPNGPTTYYVRVVSSAGCVVTDSFSIAIDGIGPRVNIFPSDNQVCPGQVVTLTASVSAVNCGPANPATACGPNSTFDIQDVGTGSSTTSFGSSPYMGFYADSRVQYLYRASELQALGLTAGAITDIAFNVADKNSTAAYNSFTIKMTCTDLQELPANYVSGLSQVLNPVSYTTFTGWNNHTLDIPYNWDGFSNLVVEVCYDNTTYPGGDDDVYYTNTSFNNSVLMDVGDLANASGCSALNSPSQYRSRPNTEFVMCKASVDNYQFTWVGSNGVTLPDSSVVFPTVTEDVTYTLNVNDGTCEGDTFTDLTIDASVLISAGNDTSFCGADTLQLNAQVLYPAIPACVETYAATSISYAAIAPTGATATGPTSDDAATNAIALPFPFTFYCQPVTQFYISANGFISFLPINVSGFTPYQIPDAANEPNSIVALCWEDLNPGNGGNIDYYTTGTAPNRVQVIRWRNVPFYTGGGTISGEIHLFETTNVIETHISSQNGSNQNTNVLGVENNDGTLGTSPAGYNYTGWVAATPFAFRFTPGTTVNAVTSVLWTPSAGLSSDTVLNPKAFPTANTTYIVSTTFASGCVTFDTVNITVASFPHTLTVSRDSICPGDTVQLTFTGNGVSYTWTPANTLSSATISNPLAFPQITTTYRVTALDSVGCRVIDTAQVNIKGNGPVTLGNDTIICPYDSLTLTPSGAPYLSYAWSTGAVTPTISTGGQTVPAQNYFVRVYDGLCYFNSDTLTLGEFNLPVVGVLPAGDTGMCVGETIVLVVEPGYASYVWNTGDTTQSITVGTAGEFSFVAADANGCVTKSKDTTTVAVSQPPVAAILADRDTICEGQPAILYVNAVAGIDYYWSPGGALTDSFTITSSGEYFLTANDKGCTALDSVTIIGVQPSVLDLGADINACGCDTSVVITATLAGTSFQWNNNARDTSITVNTSGVYSVTVTEANNCTASDAVEVNIRCLTVNAFVATPTTATVFVGGTATLDVDSFSYNGSFTYAWTPNTYLQDSGVQQPLVQAPQQSTTYTVKVTDTQYGCVAFDSVVLSVVPPGIPPMPNAFTPNGDGRNDLYGPYFPPSLAGAYTIGEMRIYNRWGQAVYNGDGYWDGTFNGAMQQAGTYLYYITIKGPDQDNPSVNKNYNLHGAFTLLH